MLILAGLVLFLSPETERLLLGPSPFFRHEGMERAVREGDVALLKKAARSIHWDARRLAAEGLGARTPHVLLKDPVAVVREAAVRALDVAAPEPLLVALLKDGDDAVRAAAAWALRARSDKRALRPLLKDKAPAVRVAALVATGNLSRVRSLALKKDDLATAVPALIALGRGGAPADARILLQSFKKAVRAAAKSKVPLYLTNEPRSDVVLARALGEMARRGLAPGGTPLSAQLRKLVEGTALEGSAAILLAEAVAGTRDAEAARMILDASLRLRKTSRLATVVLDPAVKGVLHAFSREPWPELAPLLFPFLAERDPTVRIAVVNVLQGDAVRSALRDAHWGVRAAACARVGKVKPLLRMLDDSRARVVVAATRALGRLGDPEGAPALAKLLEHGEAQVRHAAIGALLRVEHPERAQLFYRVAVQDDTPQVRAAAAAVLDFLELDDDVFPRALVDLGSDRRSVRERALALVHALTDARFQYDVDKPDRGSALWNEWWTRKAERNRPKDGFRYHVEDLRRRGIDLVLVMDATGSMGPVIQATKRRLQAVLEGLRRVVPDLRARIVAYRDRGDVFVTLGSPLTHDPRILEDFIACIPAWGGGDAPEAVLAGLREAVEKTPWRGNAHRIVVLFGDAPPHEKDRTLLEAILKEFKGVVHAVDVGGYGGGGRGSYTMPSFRRIAKWGRGTALRLATEYDLLKNLLVLTLGPRYRTAVETLFGL